MATVFGLEVGDLDEGVIPIEVVVSLKGIDENGRAILYERMSSGLSPWEAVGMLITHADGLRQTLTASYEEDDDDA